MQYLIDVQGVFYRVVEASSTLGALTIAATAIQTGAVPHFQPNLRHNIVIKKASNSLFEKWADIAPADAQRFNTWVAPDGSQWIYDQPRDADGRYLIDDPNTPESETPLRWQLILN
jgi:hypothetical protein